MVIERHSNGDFVEMKTAAMRACTSIMGEHTTITEGMCNWLADTLALAVTLFIKDEGTGEFRALRPEETMGGRFRQSGKVMSFDDGRAPIDRVMITWTAFNAAVEALRRAR